jgi:L-fucose isomerase
MSTRTPDASTRAFARLEAPAEEILARFGSNHIHAVPGDHVASLRHVCQFLGIAFDGFGGA